MSLGEGNNAGNWGNYQVIRAGTIAEIARGSGHWVFVDIGFSAKSRSCAVLSGAGEPELVTFGALADRIRRIAAAEKAPLNLLIEAPLSVAFNAAGNPTGRSIERRERQSRYWYVGLGCSVLVAAQHLIRDLHNTKLASEARLFEGLVSFKPAGKHSDHKADVLALRRAVWEPDAGLADFIPAEELKASPGDSLHSAFDVLGLDMGLPPVVALRAAVQ